jgi:hypothetical protein
MTGRMSMHITSEIYKTATLLIDAYGEMATVGATLKADQCLHIGDHDGNVTWLQVARCIEELTNVDSLPKDVNIH